MSRGSIPIAPTLREEITKWIHGWQRNGWRTANKKPVKNQDLWRRFLRAIERHQAAGGVTWEWTKGHARDELNEQVDDLANGEARQVTDLDPIDEEMTIQPDQFSFEL